MNGAALSGLSPPQSSYINHQDNSSQTWPQPILSGQSPNWAVPLTDPGLFQVDSWSYLGHYPSPSTGQPSLTWFSNVPLLHPTGTSSLNVSLQAIFYFPQYLLSGNIWLTSSSWSWESCWSQSRCSMKKGGVGWRGSRAHSWTLLMNSGSLKESERKWTIS